MFRRSSTMFSGRGDDGHTSLLGGGRVPKYALQPEAYGTLDEASAILGMVRACGGHPPTAAGIEAVQRDLLRVMADMARNPDATALRPPMLSSDRVQWLEEQIRELEGHIRIPREFVIPGDSLPGALLHLARCVVRRAERVVARMVHEGWDYNPQALPYLNRLSSYLFVLALWEDQLSVGTTLPEKAEA